MAGQRELQRLMTAAWLRTPAIRRVFEALATTGAQSRAVGGAVRNTLLGEPVDDIDIATAAKPDAVLAAAGVAGLKAIPTGIKHGTITLIADGASFEVTTLRRDVETDGRHAVVDFTDDWAVDAGRRDFTINALYCDADGTLFDPLGGGGDLDPPRIRFIGCARDRIREDYLRILRFFRFSARYGTSAIDRAGLEACAAERHGLAQVSSERVRVELLKLLAAPRASDVCRIMQAYGFLVSLAGAAPAPSRLQRLIELEAATGRVADPILRLAALTLSPCGDATALAKRLRLSGDERARLRTIATAWADVLALDSEVNVRRCIYRLGTGGFRDTLLTSWAGGSAAITDPAWTRRLATADSWQPPTLPVDGRDAQALGIVPGPQLGAMLKAVEAWWVAADFMPDRAACLIELSRQAHLSA